MLWREYLYTQYNKTCNTNQKDTAVNADLPQWGVTGVSAGHGTLLQGISGWRIIGKRKEKPNQVLSLLLPLRLPQPLPSSHDSFSNSVLSALEHWTTSLISVFVHIFILFYIYIIYIYIHWEKHVLQRRGWTTGQSDMWKSRWRTSDICQDNYGWKYPSLIELTGNMDISGNYTLWYFFCFVPRIWQVVCTFQVVVFTVLARNIWRSWE